jgi:hypothetical protein
MSCHMVKTTIVMILGANENGLDRRLGQNLQPLTKSDICWWFAVLKCKSKDWLVKWHDNDSMRHDIFTVGCFDHVAWHIYCRLLCPCGMTIYCMPHWHNNLQWICHATLTQQPTVNMSCHMDPTTYSIYVMPHWQNNIQYICCCVHVAWHIYCRLLCPCGMTYLL